MKCSLLTPDRDPMGTAIADFYKNGRAAKLRVLSSQFEEDEIPVAQLFRTLDEMPPSNRKPFVWLTARFSIVEPEAVVMRSLCKIWERTWKPSTFPPVR